MIKIYPAEGNGVHKRSIVAMNEKLSDVESRVDENELPPETQEAVKYFKYNPITEIIESERAIQTTLNSYYLGQQHKISSGGENVFFTNLTTDVNWFPVWVGLKDQSVLANQDVNGVIKPSARYYSDNLQNIEVYGPLDNTGAVTYARAGIVFSDQSIFGQEVVVAQPVNPTDYLFYEVFIGSDDTGRLVYEQEITGESLAESDSLVWWFDHPVEGRGGQGIYSRMTIADHKDGERSPLYVRPSSTLPDAHYLKVYFRTFEDRDIATQQDIEAIVSGAVYRGHYNADTNTPSLPTGSEVNGDWYKVNVGGNGFEVGDLLIYNEAQVAYDHIPVRAVTQEGIESSSLKIYDWYVKPDYLGTIRNGKAYTPFIDLQSAIDIAQDGDTIFIDGNVIVQNTSDNAFELPAGKSLYFYGSKGTTVGYATYDKDNGEVFNFQGVLPTKDLGFYGLTIRNAGGYGIRTKVTNRVDIEDCVFQYNGWDGTQLNTIVSSIISGLLGYDSTQTELQSFYAGDHASNGGALRLEESTHVSVIGNRVNQNLRGIRLQDCGVGGSGFVTRNISTQNIESGIYLAAGTTHYGCQNVVVTINSSSYNANNGLLCVGGLNNKFSQNEVNGNWNAGFCAWGAGNTTLRDCGLYDNNRSAYNGIGNTGDAKGSIQIDDAYNLLGTTVSFNPAGRFIVEVLDTQVHNTGLGSNTERIGVHLGPNLSNLVESEKNLIKIDDVGFLGQDHCIDFSEVDLTDLKVSLGDNSYQNIGISAIKEPIDGEYYELPYSNHITDIKLCDISVDSVGTIVFKEGPSGNRLNPYKVNDLQAIAHGTDVRFILKGSNKIQWQVPLSGISINGSMVNSVLSLALVQLNDVLTNTVGFSSSDNPVTDFVLSGNDLTITLQDNTSFTVDVTTLGVDENKFVTSGSLVGSNLELTMNDTSVVTIDAANMINGSTLPARAEDWYIAYGNNSGDVVIYPSVVTAIKGKQPFYNGDFLEKGEEYIWTHEVGGEYILGLYTGTEETSDEAEIMLNNKWSTNFKFGTTVKETSVGVDVSSRYASGYNISNSTLLGLSYDNDNYLRLWDLTSGSRVLIGQSNAALAGDDQTIFFGGGNQPNAKFPVMTKRYSEWTIVHDFDNSETSVIDGLEEDSVIKSNISIGQGEKFMFNFNFAGRSQRFGIDYTGASSGVVNAHTTITSSLAYSTGENLVQSGADWLWNTGSSFYNAGGPNWGRGSNVDLGMLSLIYNTDNSLELYSEDTGELIATKAVALDGNPIHFYFGVNEATTPSFMPTISKQTIGQGSHPVTSFAPDISNQSIDVTKDQAFNVQIALDSGSDIVNQYVELDAPTWAVLNQATGYFNGTAPSTTGSHVINCKAANAIGGSVNFQVTLNVVEPVYTNTKSLKFADGVNSYLGGNAALVTALERSGNGSGSADAWTIAFWMNGSSHNQGQTLFYFGASDVVNNGHVEIKQTNHNGAKRLRVRYGTNNNHLQLTTPSGSINPNNWQHVMLTYNGGTTGVASGSLSSYYSRFKVYIDGVLQTTSNTHSNNGYNGSVVGQNFRFGRFSSGNYPKDLLLNQLAIWNSDQSSNIVGLYNGGDTQDISLLAAGVGSMNTNYLPPAHYYEIEDSVSTVQDLIGTAHFVGYNFVSSDLVDDAP